MSARLLKLTLFTGRACSLCDTAKTALSQVRKTRPFELQIVNIQDPGQERWRKKYVYWIPALHIEGKEVAKGRWGENEVLKALDQWERERLGGEKESENVSAAQSNGMSAAEVFWREEVGLREYTFERVGDAETGLGDESGDISDEPRFGISRCFNCGSPEHVVSLCPEPLNRALIDLSRALFQFHRESKVGDTERFHVVEDWKLQRLCWLQDFEPGEIRGEALREALGLKDNDKGENVPWLYSMLEWGYPPGWAAEEDPREAVFKRIVSGAEDEGDESVMDDFLIFGEADEREMLSLRPDSSSQTPSARQSTASESPTKSVLGGEPQCSPEERPLRDTNSRPRVRRWAKYQTALFSSELLPIYTGNPLPPIDDNSAYPTTNIPQKSTTKNVTTTMFTSKKHDLHIEHPWRHPDAFSAFGPVEWKKRYEQLLAHRAQVFREIATYSNPDTEKHAIVKHSHSEVSCFDKSSGSPTSALMAPEGAIYDSDEISNDDMDLSD
ncbi:ZCCHC8_1 [Sanghuangporus sanghuang]